MLIDLVDIRTLVPALKLRGARPPPVALAAPRGGQNGTADQRGNEQGKPPNAQSARAPDVHPAKREESTSGSD
eukprot:7573182-Pyramimonas_sp.AAC.1